MTSSAKFYLILTLLFLSLAYADRIKWSTDLKSEVTGGLLLHGNYLYVAGSEELYKVDTISGRLMWKTGFEGTPLTPLWLGSEIIVPIREGKIYDINDISRKVVREVNLSNVRILGNPTMHNNVLYVPTSKGLMAVNMNNFKVAWTAGDCRMSATPLVLNTKIIALCEDGKVYEVNPGSGEVMVSSKYDTVFWSNAPVYYSNKVIVGGYDGKIFLISPSSTRAAAVVETADGTPLSTEIVGVSGGFIGVTTGGTLCKYKMNGEQEWCVRLDSEASAKPIVTASNIYVITDSGNIYGIDLEGNINWQVETGLSLRYDFAKKVSMMYGVSRNGKVIGVSTSSCVITEPSDGYDVAGLDYVDVNVDAYADSEINRVLVRVNGGNWIQTDYKEGGYSVQLPGNRFNVGNNQIECKVSTNTGDEQPPYSKVSVVKSATPRKMDVEVPTGVAYGSAFTIIVKDRDNGQILDNIDIQFGDLVYKNVNGKYSLTPPKKGKYELVVKKGGYSQYKTTINVGENYTIPAVLVGLLLVMLGMAYMVYRRWMEE